jgi:hypothetical protein
MRKLVVGTFVTLDGVMQAPGGPNEDRDGGFQHGGGWLALFRRKDRRDHDRMDQSRRRLPPRPQDLAVGRDRDHGRLLHR